MMPAHYKDKEKRAKAKKKNKEIAKKVSKMGILGEMKKKKKS